MVDTNKVFLIGATETAKEAVGNMPKELGESDAKQDGAGTLVNLFRWLAGAG